MNDKMPIELKLKRIESSSLIAWELLEVMERAMPYGYIKECISKIKATMQNPLFDSNYFSKDDLEEMIEDVSGEMKSILSNNDRVDEHFLLKAVLEYMVKIISDSKVMLKYHPEECREYLDNKHKLNLQTMIIYRT